MFRLHHDLNEQQRHLVLAATSPPAALNWQLADLRSRLGGGLILQLKPLSEAEQIAALQMRAQFAASKCRKRQRRIPVASYAAKHGSLCAFLDELDKASLAAQRRLTVPFVKAGDEERTIEKAAQQVPRRFRPRSATDYGELTQDAAQLDDIQRPGDGSMRYRVTRR